MDKLDCVLCRLLIRHVSGDEEIKVVYETEHVLAIHAIKPHAEVHILILSKKHIPSMLDLTEDDAELVADLHRAIKIASKEVFALKGGCKLEMNTGRFPLFTAVGHLHCHVIYDESLE